MPLTDIHIAIMEGANGRVTHLPRIGGKVSAFRELIQLGLLRGTERRIGNKSVSGVMLTADGRVMLEAHKAGRIEETRVPVIPFNPVGRVVIYDGRVMPIHRDHVKEDELGEYIEVIGIKGENDGN